jgi:hypothetical protein
MSPAIPPAPKRPGAARPRLSRLRPQRALLLRQPAPQRRRQRMATRGRRVLRWSGWSKVPALATAVAAVAALYYSGKSLQATQSQYGLSEQGQIADRFTKSVEQLGSEKVDVRLGGIYSLERIARDSSGDRPVVFEVLGAFVRSHSPVAPECRPTSRRKYLNSPTLPVDIQAAVTVIGRRMVSENEQIELRDTCLYGVLAERADLSYAMLADANLTDGLLDNANLTGAILIQANLTRAFLLDANLTDADLPNANLTKAILPNANLTNADLRYADLTGADLTGANLTNANLSGVYYEDSTVWPQGFVPPPSAATPGRDTPRGP